MPASEGLIIGKNAKQNKFQSRDRLFFQPDQIIANQLAGNYRNRWCRVIGMAIFFLADDLLLNS
jgi:hypothetical protein